MALDTTLLLEKDWLISNKIGTYASMGVSGALHSRSHSLLACQAPDSYRKISMISKIDEMIEIDGIRTPLSTNCFSLDTVHPKGFENMTQFTQDGLAYFKYKVGDTVVEKSIILDPESNMVVVKYDIQAATKGSLTVSPLLNPRYTDEIFREEEKSWELKEKAIDDGRIMTFSELPFKLLMAADGAEYKADDRWYYFFRYDRDIELGLRGREDMFSPGSFTFAFSRKGTYSYTMAFAAAEEAKELNALWEKAKTETEDIFGSKKTHEKELVKSYFEDLDEKDPFIEKLVIASNAFITTVDDHVRLTNGFNGEKLNSFREIMIAFPGIMLTTKRFDEAKDFLLTTAASIKDGVPIRYFGEEGFTSDNGFWFVYALYEYVSATGDIDTLKEVMPVVIDIGNAYMNGFNDTVSMDKTMMVVSESEGPAMTWMDGEVDGKATTDRNGKSVEVNALWYNYLKFGEFFDQSLGVKSELYQGKEKFTFKQISRKVGSRFGREFWNRRADFLYDYTIDDDKSEVSRGNQAIVVGLPFPPLEVAREKKLFKLIEKDLMTDLGIRTLTPNSAQYVQTLPNDYAGRAIGLHQGTVWPWLLDFYVKGYLRVHGTGAKSKKKLRENLDAFMEHVDSRIDGFLPQLFTSIIDEGEEYFIPEGISTSALSVGALLSMYRLLHLKK